MRNPTKFLAVLVVAGILALGLRAFAIGDDPNTDAIKSRSIASAQLSQMLKAKDFFLVNVLPTYMGEIAHTDSFISYKDTLERLKEYPKEKSAKIVVYCMSGRSSAIALQELLDAGYRNVFMLSGGMQAWELAGLPVLREGGCPCGLR